MMNFTGKSLILITISMITLCCLNACSTVQEDGPVVKTAKACQRAKERNPGVIPGFKILACTNTGVWMVDQYDEQGVLMKRFDFLNQQYAGPESMGQFVPADSMGPDASLKLQSIRQSLNARLLDPPSS